jgi:hypothetical protein
VSQDAKGKLEIKKDALKIIEDLSGSIGVCSVVGPYRTGKSFILNLLLNRSKGFDLGATTASCTRGIWMWSTPVKHTNAAGQEYHMIYLDTEGLGAPTATPDHDARIFVLSLLLSSMFVYNNPGAISRDAIKKLAIMNDLSKNIQMDTTNDNAKAAQKRLFPDFIWAARDWMLKLEEGLYTDKDYLDKCLELEAVNRDMNILHVSSCFF